MPISDVPVDFEAAEPPRRPDTIRLRCWDYASVGPHFVTVCTQDREPVFGEISGNGIVFSGSGIIAADCWAALPSHFPQVAIDEWVVMPDHFHGIVWIDADASGLPILGDVVGSFKSAVTRAIRCHAEDPNVRIWQRGYHDRIIRDQDELGRIRQYIRNNPCRAAANPSR